MADETENQSASPEGSTGGNGSDDGAAPSAEGAQEQPKPPLAISAQYVKDLSFEAPSAPGIFVQLQKSQPDISVNVDVQARTLEAPVYEVVIHIKAECKSGETVAFLAELSYGGVFTVNVPEQNLRPMLLIECPRLLFPFARQVLATTTLNGGFLPLMLGPVDFAALYQRQLQEQKAAEGAGEEQAPIST